MSALVRILASSAGRGWTGIDAALVRIPRGIAQVPGGRVHTLALHVGPPVNANCACDGKRVRRVQSAGDIAFVPSGTASVWEDDADCTLLRIGMSPSLVERVSVHAKIDLFPQLSFRDARIEAIGWAIKADLEAETPSDSLYVDHLASALAVRLLETVGLRQETCSRTPSLSRRQVTRLTDFIETHLDRQLHLVDLAAVAGLSVTRLKASFRNSVGVPVHQYVMRRRVEYARALLATTTLPASEIALAAGFAHQSHMSATMRRVLGHTPGQIARPKLGRIC